MNYWLVKSEPVKYSWNQFTKDGRTFWDGVRNYAARIHLRTMQTGDLVLFYHSNDDKAVMGIAQVVKEAYPDPTTQDDQWVAVDLVPIEPLKVPVTLARIKAEKKLGDIYLVRQPRLSVMPLKKEEFDLIVSMGV